MGILVLFLLSSCVIPPSLSVDNQDAGINSPPAILAVRSDQSELPEPGPVVFARGEGSLNVQLIDTDLLDTLYVRIFVDYTIDDPKPPRSTCTAPAPQTTSATRNVTCDLTALCLMTDVGLEEHDMTVVVFDRQPLESGSPPFQAMPEGGLSTGKFFHLKCQEGA
ncbi:MAG: hypothetical protein H0X17_01800 [Deltaproteobacteria bacterium]|nr:hypothetical protein [Deltaproteobacteria bacterium]